MEVVCIGAGPASLYTAILLKKAHPAASIRLYDREIIIRAVHGPANA